MYTPNTGTLSPRSLQSLNLAIALGVFVLAFASELVSLLEAVLLRVLEWVFTIISLGTLGLIGWLFNFGAFQFLVMPLPSEIPGLESVWYRFAMIFFGVLPIIGAVHFAMSMFFPDEEDADPYRFIERALIATFGMFLMSPVVANQTEGFASTLNMNVDGGLDLISASVYIVNGVIRIIFPEQYNVSFLVTGFGSIVDALAALFAGGASLIIIILMGKFFLIAILFTVLVFYLLLAMRLLLVYIVYAAFPLLLALWVPDIGPLKYGRQLSALSFKLAGTALMLGILIAGILFTAGTIAGSAGLGEVTGAASADAKNIAGAGTDGGETLWRGLREGVDGADPTNVTEADSRFVLNDTLDIDSVQGEQASPENVSSDGKMVDVEEISSGDYIEANAIRGVVASVENTTIDTEGEGETSPIRLFNIEFDNGRIESLSAGTEVERIEKGENRLAAASSTTYTNWSDQIASVFDQSDGQLDSIHSDSTLDRIPSGTLSESRLIFIQIFSWWGGIILSMAISSSLLGLVASLNGISGSKRRMRQGKSQDPPIGPQSNTDGEYGGTQKTGSVDGSGGTPVQVSDDSAGTGTGTATVATAGTAPNQAEATLTDDGDIAIETDDSRVTLGEQGPRQREKRGDAPEPGTDPVPVTAKLKYALKDRETTERVGNTIEQTKQDAETFADSQFQQATSRDVSDRYAKTKSRLSNSYSDSVAAAGGAAAAGGEMAKGIGNVVAGATTKASVKGAQATARGGKAYGRVAKQPTTGDSIGEAVQVMRESPVLHPDAGTRSERGPRTATGGGSGSNNNSGGSGGGDSSGTNDSDGGTPDWDFHDRSSGNERNEEMKSQTATETQSTGQTTADNSTDDETGDERRAETTDAETRDTPEVGTDDDSGPSEADKQQETTDASGARTDDEDDGARDTRDVEVTDIEAGNTPPSDEDSDTGESASDQTSKTSKERRTKQRSVYDRLDHTEQIALTASVLGTLRNNDGTPALETEKRKPMGVNSEETIPIKGAEFGEGTLADVEPGDDIEMLDVGFVDNRDETEQSEILINEQSEVSQFEGDLPSDDVNGYAGLFGPRWRTKFDFESGIPGHEWAELRDQPNSSWTNVDHSASDANIDPDSPFQGTKIHLSTAEGEAEETVTAALDALKERETQTGSMPSWKVKENATDLHATKQQNKGKFMTIYPEFDDDAKDSIDKGIRELFGDQIDDPSEMTYHDKHSLVSAAVAKGETGPLTDEDINHIINPTAQNTRELAELLNQQFNSASGVTPEAAPNIGDTSATDGLTPEQKANPERKIPGTPVHFRYGAITPPTETIRISDSSGENEQGEYITNPVAEAYNSADSGRLFDLEQSAGTSDTAVGALQEVSADYYEQPELMESQVEFPDGAESYSGSYYDTYPRPPATRDDPVEYLYASPVTVSSVTKVDKENAFRVAKGISQDDSIDVENASGIGKEDTVRTAVSDLVDQDLGDEVESSFAEHAVVNQYVEHFADNPDVWRGASPSEADAEAGWTWD